jgi:hypothetical protein
MEEKPLQSLVDVVQTALALMMIVQITGAWYDSYQPKKVRVVPCSASIQNMAAKLNVTLLSSCEVTD